MGLEADTWSPEDDEVSAWIWQVFFVPCLASKGVRSQVIFLSIVIIRLIKNESIIDPILEVRVD